MSTNAQAQTQAQTQTQTDAEDDDAQRYQRQEAVRALASEINAAKYEFQEADGDREPSFQALPSGIGANRVLFSGTLTDVEDVGNDTEYLKAEIIGATGTVYAYAGDYSQEARAFLRNAEAPMFVTICGKLNWFAEDDDESPVADRNVYIDPEWAVKTDADDRDRAVLEAAEATLDRLEADTDPNLEQVIDVVYGEDEDVQDLDLRDEVVRALENLED
ncbi:DNA-binding protein [Salinadaptatus halalkaliphilus]|uniref:DNA-binding protein n=1 Tax=Salinadaptatus halalkaliphilus TaxID=2419781 RepID=A0A4S3TNL7_9EURY|nr:DNA-binding protein [Salinadaptatus halalkaliphilus]THE65851.1 DNA-binding protein [Salinadaptatus halalkaliphilus]